MSHPVGGVTERSTFLYSRCKKTIDLSAVRSFVGSSVPAAPKHVQNGCIVWILGRESWLKTKLSKGTRRRKRQNRNKSHGWKHSNDDDRLNCATGVRDRLNFWTALNRPRPNRMWFQPPPNQKLDKYETGVTDKILRRRLPSRQYLRGGDRLLVKWK